MLAELRRLAIRLRLEPSLPTDVVDRFDVVAVTEPMLHLAATFPQRHRGTIDALHLASAVVIGARSLVTYDARLAAAGHAQGVVVEAPA